MTHLERRYLHGISLATLAAVGIGCATSGELRDRGGTVSTPTTITTGTGGTVRLDTQTEQGGRTETLDVPPDSAYDKLPRVYQGLGIDVTTVLNEQRTVGNPEVMLRRRLAGDRLSRFFECGSGPTGVPIADSYDVRMSVMSQVSPAENGTGSTVTSLVTASARPPASGGNDVNCRSRGELEKRIAQNLRIASAPR